MQRAAFVWLRRWRTERVLRTAPTPPEGPFALVERGAGGFRLAAVDARAEELGLYAGQLLADARALAPQLRCLDFNSEEDARDLRRLAHWATRWSPDVAIAPEGDGIALAISGVAHLFGGEGGLAADMHDKLAGSRFSACVAIADTFGQAAALARCDPRAGRFCIAPEGAGLAAIAHLPVASLRIEARTADALRAVGLKRVGDLVRQERGALARRFGRSLIARLDEASGNKAEAMDPSRPEEVIAASLRFAEPLLDLEALREVSAKLSHAIADKLAAKALGARGLILRFYRADGETTALSFGAAEPERDGGRLARLAAERLGRATGRLDLGFGIDAAMLSVRRAERIEARPATLDPEVARNAEAERAAAALADKLAARFGPSRTVTFVPVASHLPERAQRRALYEEKPSAVFAAEAPRPILVFRHPEPIEATAEVPDAPPRRFRWRRVMHRVARAEGPERIAAEWWRKSAATRDYYRIETEEGRRLWLFREGLFERETDRPAWFVHGCFG